MRWGSYNINYLYNVIIYDNVAHTLTCTKLKHLGAPSELGKCMAAYIMKP